MRSTSLLSKVKCLTASNSDFNFDSPLTENDSVEFKDPFSNIGGLMIVWENKSFPIGVKILIDFVSFRCLNQLWKMFKFAHSNGLAVKSLEMTLF